MDGGEGGGGSLSAKIDCRSRKRRRGRAEKKTFRTFHRKDKFLYSAVVDLKYFQHFSFFFCTQKNT